MFKVGSILIITAILLTGCADKPTDLGIDQCLRNKIFYECLERIPKGPENVHYNDWSEVIDTCSSAAYYQSLRQRSQIEPSCFI